MAKNICNIKYLSCRALTKIPIKDILENKNTN